MSTDPLHPNLARIAATYDQITADWAADRMNVDTARARLEELVARDDQGVLWRINPDNGEWERHTLDSTWEPAEPPTWGLSTAGGWEISGGTDPFADPRRRIESREIDPARVTDTSSLAGATVRASNVEPAEPEQKNKPNLVVAALAAAAVVVVFLVGVRACGGDTGGEERAPVPTTAPVQE